MSNRQEPEMFQNEQEYYEAVLWVTKKKIDLYCRMCVDVTENGAVSRIRGKLLFQRELDRLLEPVFSEEEIQAYREEISRIQAEEEHIRRKAAASIAGGQMFALEYLSRLFGLDGLDRHLVTMSLAAELDGQFERVYCLLQDDFSLKMPTLDLCIRVLTLDQGERLLLQQRAIEHFPVLSIFFDGLRAPGEDASGESRGGLLSEPLKLCRRIRLFLQDITSMEDGLQEFVRRVMPGDVKEPAVIRADGAGRLEALIDQTQGRRFVHIWGSREIGKKTLVRQLCRRTKRPLLMVSAGRLSRMEDRERLIRDLIRESRLCGSAWICIVDAELPENPEASSSFLEELMWNLRDYEGVPLLTSTAPWNALTDTAGRQCLEYGLPDTNIQERELLWEYFLPRDQWPEGLDARRIARKYALPPGSIIKSIDEARQRQILEEGAALTPKMLFCACQKQLVHKLGKDAVRVKSPYTWEDLILPESQKRLLRDACNQVEYEDLIYQEWGFRQKVAYGRGVSMIFYGPPGTGKTMGAQVMANELNLELYKVNMAGVMSRYVGDSEKKLDEIFEQGKRSQSILFFDEADVLFGKRSETKDAQDKYANASTAYLLQKVEEYEGILILATNFLQNFDNAFRRRFKFIIEFPFPDEASRRSIWEHVFPDGIKLEEPPDVEWLAEEYKFSGSQIKNIALAASFLAAGERKGLNMKHILTALKREQAKEGKQMIASDFGKYYYLMEEETGR